MKLKLFYSCLLSAFSFLAYADQSPVTGKIKVIPGEIETYTIDWIQWGSIYENYANVNWDITNGTVISSDKHTVTIQWNENPVWMNETGSISVTEDLGGGEGGLSVSIDNFTLTTSEACIGVLGTPVVFESFGAGLNPGPPILGTNYIYRSYCTISPGDYTRRNSTVGCRGQWLGIPLDHTPGDINGYMLMVDGDTKRGEVFQTQVTAGLTSAFRYEFSAWIASLSGGSQNEKPKIHFELRDNSYNLVRQSGQLEVDYDPTDPWKRVSVMFDIPRGTTSLYILLINENNDYYGNDFVVDDLSFAPCYTPIIASFSNTTIEDRSYICNNGTVNLYSRWPTATIPFTNPSFKWQRSIDEGTSWTDMPGATALNFTKTESVAGIYQYRMYAYETSNPSQFVTSNAITYYVQKMVVNAKTYSVYSCNTSPVQLVPSYYLQYSDPSGPALSYIFNWSPSTYLNSSNIEAPTISLPPLTPPNINAPAPPPPINYIYSLNVQNTNFIGCVASNTQTVLHYNPRKVVVPTAFTPDGDGINDLFRPLNLQDYPGGEFWIWNRWGNLVFYSQGPTLLDNSWNGNYSNGQPADPGNYVWRVAIPGCPTYIWNGAGGSQINVPNGNVVLIR